jgi:hypothetical protein
MGTNSRRWASVAVLAALVAVAAGSPPARAGVGNLCALAQRQHLLPTRDMCVNAFKANVTGHGSTDLVLLYDQTRPGAGGSVEFGPYTLKVIPAAGGGVLQTTVPSNLPPVFIVAAGHVNDEPGVELFIQVARISSGSGVAIYGDQHGSLVRSHVTLSYGGDSATRFGFSCNRAPRPEIVQRSYELLGPDISGRWKEKIDTYAWRGSTLRLLGSRSTTHYGWPDPALAGVGNGCDPIQGY